MRKGLIYLLLLLIMTMSCTKENLEDCFSGVRLRFRFTLHEQRELGNLFGQNIGHLRVYVFDQNGVLQRIETEKGPALTNDYVMPLDLEPGRYSIVVWASDNEDFFRTYNQLRAVSQSRSSTVYKELEVGVSRIEELCIFLESEPAGDFPEGVKPTVDNFDDLYFGAVGTRSSDGNSKYTIIPIEVGMTQIIEREVELIRNTNIVRIIIEGLEQQTEGAVVPADLLDILATGTNTHYKYDNTLWSYTPLVRNFAQYKIFSAKTVQADVKIERLEWTKQSGERVKLHVKLKNGTTLYSGELLSLLKQAKDNKGNYIYKNQEDLDCIYIHPLRFVVARDDESQDLYVKIFIHNWELVTLIPEI